MFRHHTDLGGKYNSRLEAKVMNEFKLWDFEPNWNYTVESFDIDFAFPDIKLAIEIDGAKFHGENRKEQDEWRQKLLEKKGWTFERFDGWFAHRHTEVLVAKILLKYFKTGLNKRNLNRAYLTLGYYFKDIDPKLSEKLLGNT